MKRNQENFEAIVAESVSIAQVLRRMGLRAAGGNYQTVRTLIAKYCIDTPHFLGQSTNSGIRHKGGVEARPAAEILRCYEDWETIPKTAILRRALNEADRTYKCKGCDNRGLWLDRAISLEIHHIDGDRRNNRLSNLTYLCPNCHSQTNTFRNKKRA